MMWAQIVNSLLGVWLMAAPAVFGYTGAAAVNDRIFGPIGASFAFVAIWEILRPLRWINLVIGGWLLAAPWVLHYERVATVNSTVVGLLFMALAAIGGKVKQRYAGGWSSLLVSRHGDQ